MSTARTIAIATALSVISCNAVLGLDDRPAREGEGGGGACGATCVLTAPAGWSGPTAVRTGTTEPQCAGDVPNRELLAHAQPSGAAPLCECSCGPLEGIDCSQVEVVVEIFSDNNCAVPKTTFGLTQGDQCVNHSNGDSGRFVPGTPDITSASCEPSLSNVSLPDVQWGEHLLGCGPVPLANCGDERCLAPPAGTTLCVFQAGDRPCPPGAFTERTLWFGDYDDSRECGACACVVADAACHETVVGYRTSVCTETQGELVEAPDCLMPVNQYDSVRLEGVAPTGECVGSTGPATGTVVPSEPTTVCCTP